MNFPILQFNRDAGMDTYKIYVKNVGQGPAFISGFKMRYNHKEGENIEIKNRNGSTWIRSMKEALIFHFNDKGYNFYISGHKDNIVENGTWLAAGDTFNLFKITYSPKYFEDVLDWLLLFNFLMRLEILPIYRSQYQNLVWEEFLKINPINWYKSILICPTLPFKSEYIFKTILESGEIVPRPMIYQAMYPHRLDEEPKNEIMAENISNDKSMIELFNRFMNLNIKDYFILLGLKLYDEFQANFELANIRLVKDLWNSDLKDLESMGIARYLAKHIIYRKK